MHALGIDIGTTTVSAVILDGGSGAVIRSLTQPNTASISGCAGFEKCQDADLLWRQTANLVAEAVQLDGPLASIGVTGQMHGILYVDDRGNAVSPLYTWQDESGSQLWQDGRTYAEILSERIGAKAASGFGLTTLFYHQMNGRIPPEARQICTIGDYLVMKLTGRKRPIITAANAAGIGGFLIPEGRFNDHALANAGVVLDYLPEISPGYDQAGVTGQGVIVSAAIGDNQASVIGSLKHPVRSVLVNIGTGSQVSAGIRAGHHEILPDEIELRPCLPGIDILVGAPLCGGRAYAVLESFYRAVAAMAGLPDCGSLYARMGQLLENSAEEPLQVVPHFCGTRQDPRARGSISNIGLDNFTPGALAKGLLQGIAAELSALYQRMILVKGCHPDLLVGSGNGIRRNPQIKKIIEQIFGMKLMIPAYAEEAAFGAALYSLVCAGFLTISQAQALIQYADPQEVLHES